MEITDAIIILSEFKTITENYIMQDALNIAINALEKQIPQKPKIESWSPALCPTCEKELSESVGDGYYKHWYSMKICECGQKLKWE